MPDSPDQQSAAAESAPAAPEPAASAPTAAPPPPPVVSPTPSGGIPTQVEFPVIREPDPTSLDRYPPLLIELPPMPRPVAPLPAVAPAPPEPTQPQGPPTLETPVVPVVPAPPSPPLVRRPEAVLESPAPPELPRALRRADGRSKAISILMPVTGSTSALGVRLLVLGALLAGGFAAYRAFQRRVAHRAIAARQELEGALALQPGMTVAPALGGRPHLAAPSLPVFVPAETLPRAATALTCLNLRADVHAQVVIDDGPVLPLPLDAYPVGPGTHRLAITPLRRHHPIHRLEVTDDDTRCPGRQLSVTLRRHPARD